MHLHSQVLEEMEKEDSGKERGTLVEEQASADVAIDVPTVDGPLDSVSAPALEASVEEESMLQSTGPKRDLALVSEAIEVHVPFSSLC